MIATIKTVVHSRGHSVEGSKGRSLKIKEYFIEIFAMWRMRRDSPKRFLVFRLSRNR
jgi:hypothetical protein